MMKILKLVFHQLRIPLVAWRKIKINIDESSKRRRCRAHSLAILHGGCQVNNPRSPDFIQIGQGTHVHANLQTLAHGGSIKIGENCFVGPNSYIWSAQQINIGDRVLISHGVNIHDSIAHSLSAAARQQHFRDMVEGNDLTQLEGIASAPVVIEDDVWIGFNATVLKGVTIGQGAIVGACALVTADVAPYTVVVGNPAREIGRSIP